MNIQIKNLPRLLAKLSPSLIFEPLGNFLKRSAVQVQTEARRNTMSTWSDSGQTAGAIDYEIDKANPPLYAKVGWTDASPGSALWFKARAGEFGTGRVGDPAVSHMSGHFPPGAALDGWAKRHGFKSGFQVARIIARRGGIRPRRPLRTGFDSSVSTIRDFLGKMGTEIRERFDRG